MHMALSVTLIVPKNQIHAYKADLWEETFSLCSRGAECLPRLDWIAHCSRCLSSCQNILSSNSCRPGSDWNLWKVRVIDIVVGCCLAMAVSWLVLPWFTSDEHLGLLADALSNAGRLVEEMYTVFHKACQATSKVQFPLKCPLLCHCTTRFW